MNTKTEHYTQNSTDIPFTFLDTPTLPLLIDEIFKDNYDVIKANLSFSPGDVVLDVGANEGIFSIWMSKLFPQTSIVALEPVPSTFDIMVENIGINGCRNIKPLNLGVGKPGQKSTTLYTNRNGQNTGGASSLFTFNPEVHESAEVHLITLDEVFYRYGIDHCRLLKMDIEGAEYEALYNSYVLPHIDYLVMEAHMNSRLTFQSRRADGLLTWCSNRTKVIHFTVCNMAE
jgi:FkbM family methyltransferase